MTNKNSKTPVVTLAWKWNLKSWMNSRKTHRCNYVISASRSCSLLAYMSKTDSSGKGRWTRWTWCIAKLEKVDWKLTTASKSLFHIPHNLIIFCGHVDVSQGPDLSSYWDIWSKHTHTHTFWFWSRLMLHDESIASPIQKNKCNVPIMTAEIWNLCTLWPTALVLF